MPSCPPELLADSPIFRKFSSQTLEDLSQLALDKHLSEGEFLAHQGQNWPYLLLIERGMLKTHKVSPGGRALGALRLKRGRVFCSPTLIDGGPLPASLEAGSDCDLFLWHGDHILPYLQKNTQALWELSTLLVQRIRHASEMVEDLAFHPVANRVARLLLKQHQQRGEAHVDRNLTLDEMATMTGTTPVMVCKILSQFADDGLIKVSRTEIEFIDRKELERMIGNT
jgi:CRP-like cAMP-binding protein